MKKISSYFLALIMILSAGAISVSATEVSTSFIKNDSFFYSFEKETDLTHPNVLFDEQGTDNFKADGIANYTTPGYGNSSGAVGIHVETEVSNGNTSGGITGFTMYPGKEYEFTMKAKLFSAEILKNSPSITLFFMTREQEVFRDEACTQSAGTSNYHYQYTTFSGATVFPAENGVVSDDWGTFTTKISISNLFSSNMYVPKDKPVRLNLFVRIGGVHALNDSSIYKDSFLATCGTHDYYDMKRYSLWLEYAIDDIGLRPASCEKSEQKVPALWRVSFDDAGWANEIPNSNTHFAQVESTRITSDVPKELSESSQGSIEAIYKAHNDNNGFLEFNVYTSIPANKIQYNRAYLISYWIKGSEAVEKYYREKTGKTVQTQLIAGRDSLAHKRLDRTFPMWTSYSVKEPITSEWTKHTYLWYEDIPSALGMNEEKAWDLNFHVRVTSVPSQKEGIWTSADGISYEPSDFKVYMDEFEVIPYELAYNGDFSENGTATDVSTISYNGANDTYTITQNCDTLSANAFHSGTITEDASFAESTGIRNKNVLKITTDDVAPMQKVRMEKNTPYRISFWAKADDAASIGKPIHTILDRNIIGSIRDNQPVTYTDIPKWIGYMLDRSDTQDVTVNTEGYDGYGKPTGETGSIPNYLYDGIISHAWHNPDEPKPANYEEALVYDDYYDRAFSKNTQAGIEPTAWMYQYYNGKTWVNTNEATYDTSCVLSDEWTYYEMEYQWDYEGKHYRIPKLIIDADANYSLADIEVKAIDPTAEKKTEFSAENLRIASSSGKSLISTNDKITVKWDFVSSGTVHTTEANGGALVKLYQVSDTKKALIGTATAEKAGFASITPPAEAFGKKLAIEVIPMDAYGNFGVPVMAETDVKVSFAANIYTEVSEDETNLSWSVSIISDDTNGNANVYIAAYDINNRLIRSSVEPMAYQNGENGLSGNFTIEQTAVTLKVFLWNDDFCPLIQEEEIKLIPALSDPFSGDDTINIVYLGDSIYAGAGASPQSERWVEKVGAWFEQTYEKDGVTVNNYYKGIGGTPTEYSLLRVFRDVIAYEPDLVFISHTCNDGNRDTRRNMESIVRTLMGTDHVPYIIFTRTTNRDLLKSNGYSTQVAAHYGLRVIDDRNAFIRATEESGKTAPEYFISDGVHPNNDGYDVIANEIIACMENGRYFCKPILPSEKLVENSGELEEITFHDVTTNAITKSANWEIGEGFVKSKSANDTLSFSFTGDILGMEYGLYQAAGKLDVFVDGELIFTANPYYPDVMNHGSAMCRVDGVTLDLPYGTHHVVIKTAPGENDASYQENVIYKLITGSWKSNG